jgi:hypothetical protein
MGGQSGAGLITNFDGEVTCVGVHIQEKHNPEGTGL